MIDNANAQSTYPPKAYELEVTERSFGDLIRPALLFVLSIAFVGLVFGLYAFAWVMRSPDPLQ